MNWQPLLNGPLAERARQVIDEIAAILAPPPDLQTVDREAPPASLEPPASQEAGQGRSAFVHATPEAAAAAMMASPGVAGGTSGVALFFAYRAALDRTSAGGAAADSAANSAASTAAGVLLDRSTDALATTPMPPDLYGGFAGVAWAAEHLYGPRFATATAETPETPENTEDDDTDPLAEIDEALLSYLDHSPWKADYDLIRGLTGLGVYALERLPRPSALACLTKIVDRFAETAEHGPQGITWHTAPELLPDWQRALYPTGYYNLGVAHGVPAVVALLAVVASVARRLAASGDGAPAGAAELAPRAEELARGAARWLLAQRMPAGSESWYGASFSDETPAHRSRLAWCYGDPGIAATQLLAARALGDYALEQTALELALDTCDRPVTSAGVRDAGLCHGSAGLAHLFNRLYQETGEPKLAEASRTWFERALDFRQPGIGLAGYRAFWVEDDGVTEGWRPEAGLLEGVAGIGLALIGGLSDFEPAWDRLLMLSAATGHPSD